MSSYQYYPAHLLLAYAIADRAAANADAIADARARQATAQRNAARNRAQAAVFREARLAMQRARQ